MKEDYNFLDDFLGNDNYVIKKVDLPDIPIEKINGKDVMVDCYIGYKKYIEDDDSEFEDDFS